MQISGLVKTSLIDYPGKIAAVVFTQGCNFRCGFCHNPDLLDRGKGRVDEDEFWNLLVARKGKLDGVVITGGEPLLQKDIYTFIDKIKKSGFLVKLDTNGSNPELLNCLIENKLIDYVAMDIKGPLAMYERISGYLNTNVIQKSVSIIKMDKVDYEFRTTVLPYYHKIDDFEAVGKLLKDSKLFTLQNFRPEITYDSSLKNEGGFTLAELNQIRSIMEKYVKRVILHANMD